MTDSSPACASAWSGYAFMGAAHSQALAHRPPLLRPAARARAWPSSCGRDADRAAEAADRLGWARARDRLARRWSPATTSTSSTSAPRATPTPRSRSPRSRPASTCSARSRWPTPSPRPRRWPPRPSAAAGRGVRAMVGFTYRRVPGHRAGPRRWSPRAGSARSATCARSTCRTGSSTRRRRWPGGCDKEKAGSGALGDIGAHIVDLAQFITGEPDHGASRHAWRPSSRSARSPAEAHRARAARPAGERGPVTVDDAALVPRPVRRRRARRLRGDPVRHRPQERASASRSTGRTGSLAFDLEDMNVLQLLRRHRARRRRRASGGSSSPSPSTPTSRAWWPPGHGLGYEHGFTHQVVDLVDGDRRRRRSPTPSFADGLAGPAGARRRGAQSAAAGSAWPSVDPASPQPTHERTSPWRDRSPCSPASGPTCRSRRSRGWPPGGATTASRSPAGATTSTRGAAPSDDDYVAGQARRSSSSTASRSGRSPTTSRARRSATTRSTQRHRDILPDAVWGDGDPEGVRQRAAEEMKHDRPRRARSSASTTVVGLHRLVDLEVRRDVPAGLAGRWSTPGYQDFADRWNPILDVFDEVRRAVRPRGAPQRDRLRLLDDRRARWRRSATARRSASTGTRATWSGRTSTRSASSGTSRTGSTTSTARTRRRRSATAATAGSARTCRGPTRAAAGTSSPPATATCRGRTCFRMLNTIGYDGPISVEWEDAGMDRLVGAPEALEFVRRLAVRRPRRRPSTPRSRTSRRRARAGPAPRVPAPPPGRARPPRCRQAPPCARGGGERSPRRPTGDYPVCCSPAAVLSQVSSSISPG